MYRPLLTSPQVQDLRMAVEIAAQRGVQRYARRFAVLLVVVAIAAGLAVHTVDRWLLFVPARCGGR